MKLKFGILAVLLVCCLALAGCGSSAPGQQSAAKKDGKLHIVTSFYPMYVATINITKGVDGVEVVNMCENNTGCLHNFQLRSDDLKKIEKSSAFVINGGGMELFVDKITSELPKVKIVDSSNE